MDLDVSWVHRECRYVDLLVVVLVASLLYAPTTAEAAPVDCGDALVYIFSLLHLA